MSWTQRDGAPVNIEAIVQTEDGYLWVGSSFGLYRFDGVTFVSYPVTQLDSALPAAGVTALSSDGEDGLWIGYDRGGITHLTHTGTITNYNPRNGRGPQSVVKFIHRPDGSVWCLGDNKVFVLAGDHWEDFGSQAGLPHDQYFLLYFDREGALWTSARKKLYVLRQGQRAFSLYPTESFIVVDMAEEPDGRLWISDGWRTIRPLESDRPRIEVKGYVRLLEADGSLWMAQDYRGVAHVRPKPDSAVIPEPVKENDVSSEQTNVMFKDREGNIWVGTSRGLDSFHPSILNEVANTRIEYYPSLAADSRGLVWIGMLPHPVVRSMGDDLTPVGPWIGSSPMVTDDAGRLWLVDPIQKALLSYGPEGVQQVPTPADVHGVDAQSIGLDRDGAILVSFDGAGLWRFDGTWERVLDKGHQLDDPLSIFRDQSGRVWLGYTGELIVRDALGFRVIRDARTLNIGSILTFHESQGKLWIGGANGVAFFDEGLFHPITLQRGGGLRGVSGIVSDASENLWLNAGDGIIRIKAEEIRAILHNSHYVLDYDLLDQRQGVDGVATQLHPTPSAVAGNGSVLWFSRLGTVFSINPAQFSPTITAPKPVIESILINGVPVQDREHQRSTLSISAAHLAKLEFDYAGVDLISPGTIRYEYMLMGEDKTWQKAGQSRQAFYSHLGPGTYRFQVRATADKKQWTELIAPVLLTIEPEFYQRLWFRMACVLLAMALLYALYVVRLGIVTSRLRERMQIRSSERLRIARELHDTLLQAVHGLMLRVHFATGTLPENEPARDSLEQAIRNADALILEGRKRVQDLREEIPDDVELSGQITRLAEELELDKLSSFRIVEEGFRMTLQADVQAELCRIAREALRNSRYHAQASVVEVHLIYETGHFMMKCCDNGVGVPASIVTTGNRPGHWGLASMRERTNVIGGHLQVWSSPRGGTEVIVKLSARRAYQLSASRWSKVLRTLPFLKNGTEPSEDAAKNPG